MRAIQPPRLVGGPPAAIALPTAIWGAVSTIVVIARSALGKVPARVLARAIVVSVTSAPTAIEVPASTAGRTSVVAVAQAPCVVRIDTPMGGRRLSAHATPSAIPPGRFVGPACVIDVTREVAKNQDFLLMPAHILAWEKEHGRIPAGAWVLLRTDWSKRTDAASFLNVGADGPHSPGFHGSVSALLAKDRDVLGVGVETVGTDAGQAATFTPPFPNHTTMHGAGKFGLASLRNLDQLPATGAVVIAAPLKIVGGSGSPLRVLAIAPR